MKKSIAILLGITILLLCCTCFAEIPEIQGADFKELVSGAYKIEGSGYLFVGTDKAALFDGNQYNASAEATVSNLAEGKEVIRIFTSDISSAPIKLGGISFEAIPISGSLNGTAYLDTEHQLLVSGNTLGDGMADLSKQALDSDAHWYINAYKAYLDSIKALNAKIADLDKLDVYTQTTALDKQYVQDLNTVVQLFVDASSDIVLRYTMRTGSVGDFTCDYGTASILVHMPFGGLYGYEFGGTTMCTSDDQYKFYICDYGAFQTIRDTDIQSCYVLMNDEEALLIDCDMYNGKLFWETVEKLIGERKLSLYLTHNHGDHLNNLESVDASRLTAIYWPKDEPAPTWGYDLFSDEQLSKKIVLLDYDTPYTLAGRELVLCKMTSHTPGGTVIVNKTDRVLFAGDALGTQTYKGGTSTGSLTAQEYLAELEYLETTYGTDFDAIYQAHNLYSTPNTISYLKTACTAFIEKGAASLINGTVFSFNGNVLNAETYAAFLGNS
ncbi:MAG: MBL fold metallo-hydrolase, partial [Clostridiales bacterium]|nr:MBL fold metallo-hydrolase [Clostridiales bacterium]